MIRTRALFSSLTLLTLSTAGAPASPQEDSQHSTPIVLRPAAAPIPALKYGLLPERRSLIPGNAAVFYHRAIEMFLEMSKSTTPAKQDGAASVTDEQVVADWIAGALESIPRDRARQHLDKYRGPLREARLGALRQTCNWEFDSREEGFELPLPEINPMRSLTRLVVLQARVAVLDRKTEEAIEWLQTGYAMARHISEGPFLIQGMIGCAMTALLAKPLEDLIQTPGTPSLFWAMANRPRPMIDLSAGFEGERFLLEREIPRLRDLDKAAWSLEQARTFTSELQDKLFKLNGSTFPVFPISEPPALRNWSRRLGLAVLVAQVYPQAKRGLIAQGRPSAQVEAMPAVQVAAFHTFQLYQQLRDDAFKWIDFPYHDAIKGVDQAMIASKAQGQSNPLLDLFTFLVPPVRSVQMAQLRVDRQLDAIRCIEAIRIYCAAHGKFPAALHDITEAPVPLDVATGQPFGYRALGEQAILSAPSPHGGDVPHSGIMYDLDCPR
jgi:hypothetical protein